MRPLDHPAGEDYPANRHERNARSDALYLAAQRPEQPPTNSRWPECGVVGYLVVGGRKVGMLRCDKPVGHNSATPNQGRFVRHRAILEWDDDAAAIEEWPERYDPDEVFDVEVDPDETFEGTTVDDDGALINLDDPPAEWRDGANALPFCPECREGKHRNCNGATWDMRRDEVAPCPCATGNHGVDTSHADQRDNPPAPGYER